MQNKLDPKYESRLRSIFLGDYLKFYQVDWFLNFRNLLLRGQSRRSILRFISIKAREYPELQRLLIARLHEADRSVQKYGGAEVPFKVSWNFKKELAARDL